MIVGRGAVYRGGPGMWSFVLHRVTGLVLAAWILLFSVEQSTVLLGADSSERFRDVVTTGPFRLLEIAVVAAALSHALNGLRLVALDLWPGAVTRHRRLDRVQAGLFFALFVPAAWVILARFFEVG